jgi:hypothetical protein
LEPLPLLERRVNPEVCGAGQHPLRERHDALLDVDAF